MSEKKSDFEGPAHPIETRSGGSRLSGFGPWIARHADAITILCTVASVVFALASVVFTGSQWYEARRAREVAEDTARAVSDLL